MAAKKVYLVDTENVGAIWREILQVKETKDQLLIFYTENSPNISYEDLELIRKYPDSFEMIRCSKGKNALDFQLISYMGFLLKSSAKSEYYILSNDAGYDAAISFWKEREYQITRITTAMLRGAEKAKEEVAQNPDEKPQKAAGRGKNNVPQRNNKTVITEKSEKTETMEAVNLTETDVHTGKQESDTKLEKPAGKTNPVPVVTEKIPTAVQKAAADAKENLTEETVSVRSEKELLPGETASPRRKKKSEFQKQVEERKALHRERKAALEAQKMSQTEEKQEPLTAQNVPAKLEIQEEKKTTTEIQKSLIQQLYQKQDMVVETQQLELIYEILGNNSGSQLQALYLSFVKAFGQEEGSRLYKVVKSQVKNIYQENKK